MCGIAGIFDFRRRGDIDRILLHRMTEIIAHRGPDGDGFHIAPGIGLGMRRLAIVDLVTGDQPQFNEDGTVCVVYNGEIYNFQPLMAELTALGHDFRTRSDTEVIVHAWEEWGEACLDRFNGMFAFALWDAGRETLFLARDRLGEKPLYYSALADGRLLFASELKSLALSPDIDRRLDPQAIDSPAGQVGEHVPHGVGVCRPGQPGQRDVEGIEPVRELQVFDDVRKADVTDRVASPAAALALQPLLQMTPRAGVEGAARDEPELALLLVLLNGELEDHPVGVGWLETRETPADLDQLPAGFGHDFARELGHRFAAGGLLHG